MKDERSQIEQLEASSFMREMLGTLQNMQEDLSRALIEIEGIADSIGNVHGSEYDYFH